MDIAIIALTAVCVINILFGLIVLLRDPRSRIMQSFFVLTLLISAWAASNYITEYASNIAHNRFFNRMAFMFGFLAITSATIFSNYFSGKVIKSKRILALSALAVILMAVLSYTTLVSGTVYEEKSKLVFTIGPLILVFIAAIIIQIFVVIRNLRKMIKHGTPAQKNQIKIISAALIISIVIGVIANVIIPIFSASFESAKYGPSLLSLFLVSTMSYAIIKHKVFDIRLIIARAVGYILSLIVIVGVYSLVILTISRILFLDQEIRITQQLVYLFSAIILGIAAQPTKHFFDRVTNKLFYRDAYEPQDLLNELNNLLVSQIEINRVLKDSGHIIRKYLKLNFVQFYVNATDNTGARLATIGETDGKSIQQAVSSCLQDYNNKLLITDDLPDQYTELKNQLLGLNIAAVVRLRSSSQQGKDIGFLAMGIKLSGSIYNKQDIRMVSIMADELVIAIQNALRFEEIQQFNITLQQKIDDATRQLRRANEKLKALDETKDEFISMASHQLRTPLTSVKGYVSMVLEGDVGKVSSAQRKLLDQAFVSSQRMVYLIADLLNVSRLRTGKFIIENKPTNLADVVETEISQLTETAKGRNLELTFDKPKSFPTLMLDETKIRQVIMNFADNAIYYTPSGGHIQINLAETPKSVEFTVVDDGLGVPKHDQHHLFSKFFRAGNAKKARPDGTGLGLFMAKKVVIAQGGAIIFNSTEDKGSTFGFSFPKAKLKVNSVASQSK